MYGTQHIVDLFLDYSPSFYLAREFLYACPLCERTTQLRAMFATFECARSFVHHLRSRSASKRYFSRWKRDEPTRLLPSLLPSDRDGRAINCSPREQVYSRIKFRFHDNLQYREKNIRNRSDLHYDKLKIIVDTNDAGIVQFSVFQCSPTDELRVLSLNNIFSFLL